MAKHGKLGIIIVTYGEGKEIKRLLDIIQKEKKQKDKVSLIDNHPDHKTAEVARKHPAVDVVIDDKGNTGYAIGNNLAAKAIEKDVDLLLFLNPDSQPEPGAITKLREYADKTEWAAWMGLLMLEDGKTVNSAGNIIHITGLSWISGFGRDFNEYDNPSEVRVVSGADFIIRKEVWKKVNRFPEIYYIYYEDTEISLDIQMLGLKIGMLPDARVLHGYKFYNSPRKWELIERNRYIFIIRAWPLGVILVLAPLLAITEVGLWLISALQRRFILKIKSTIGALRLLPRALKERREVRAHNILTALEFFELLEPKIDTPLLPAIMRSTPVNWFFEIYYSVAKLILMTFSSRRP